MTQRRQSTEESRLATEISLNSTRTTPLCYNNDVDVEKLWAQADASVPISSITPARNIIKCNYQPRSTE